MQWFHRLDGNYIALITAIQGFVFAHSTAQTYIASKDGQSSDTSKGA
jgi:hypothetical protein